MPTSIESVLLATARISTKLNGATLTNATGFFYERDGRLYVLTSRHVVTDPATGHAPDSLDLAVHTDQNNLAATGIVAAAVRTGTTSHWREVTDTAGVVDVVALPIDRASLPPSMHYKAFTPDHICRSPEGIEVGDRLIVVGFPLGFHDTLHELPVARSSMIASSFGFRFSGEGYFLTDGRLHRGASGSPVLKRIVPATPAQREIPWMLLGVHSARLDSAKRDTGADEALGLNIAWYADVIDRLTET